MPALPCGQCKSSKTAQPPTTPIWIVLFTVQKSERDTGVLFFFFFFCRLWFRLQQPSAAQLAPLRQSFSAHCVPLFRSDDMTSVKLSIVLSDFYCFSFFV